MVNHMYFLGDLSSYSVGGDTSILVNIIISKYFLVPLKVTLQHYEELKIIFMLVIM